MPEGIVLDSSIAVAWAFDDEGDAAALSVADYLVDSFAVVPQLWHVELANAMSVGLRRERIDDEGVHRFMDLLSHFDIRTDAAPPDAGRLALVAAQWSLSAYDSSYLLLAQERGLALATGDRALARTAARAGVPVYGASR